MAAMKDVDDDDTLYIALGRNIQDGKPILIWALQNLEPNGVRVLHVIPPKVDELSAAGESLLRDIGEMERELMLRKMDNYIEICRMAGVNAIVLHKEKHDVEEGIVELVYQHSIKRLVMGAASDKHYSQQVTKIRSRKAKYVRQNAPSSCQFWFISQGSLVKTRRGDAHEEDVDRRLVCTFKAVYNEEMRRRKEAEEALAKLKEEKASALRLIDELLRKQDGTSAERIQDGTQNVELSLRISEGDHGTPRQPPFHFVCPISQEVMVDPHFAADGFTYEAQEIKRWLENHDTSPMTQERLAHRDIIPNRSLRSAIQEWLCHNP